MAKNTLEADIRSRIASLATELSSMIRQEAMASVEAALGGNGSAPARRGRRRGPGRPPSAAAAELAPKVLAQVKAKAGQGVSDIAKALKVNVERVKPVMAKLLAGKQVKKTGQKRGTKYHAR